MKQLLLVGGGGHCRACIDVVEAEGVFQVRGVVQPVADASGHVLNYPVVGSDDDLEALLLETPHALVTVGQIKSPATRMRLFKLLKAHDAILPAIASPTSYRSPHASIGEGTILMHGSVVNASAEVGANCIINSHALVEHDATVASHCHIATGVRVNGGVRIGKGSFVGSGAIIKEGVEIGERVIIGAGETVLRDIPSGMTVIRRHD